MPVPRACDSVDEARGFFPGGAMVKAVAGGGGRGMRAVFDVAELAAAYERCRSEAKAAFGSDAVYIEALIQDARHIEVQIVGDEAGNIVALGERDCSLQRRHQKIVEIAPAPNLAPATRAALTDSALTMARAANCVGLATFEFLVRASGEFFYIETNPRLQVEHTITEEVIGIDLVQAQLRIARGETLTSIGIAANARSRAAPPSSCGSTWRPSRRTEPSCRQAARLPLTSRRPGRASASMAMAMAAIGPVRITIPCSPS